MKATGLELFKEIRELICALEARMEHNTGCICSIPLKEALLLVLKTWLGEKKYEDFRQTPGWKTHYPLSEVLPSFNDENGRIRLCVPIDEFIREVAVVCFGQQETTAGNEIQVLFPRKETALLHFRYWGESYFSRGTCPYLGWEQIGDCEYDITEVSQWLLEGQEERIITGRDILQYLEKNERELSRQLSIVDLWAIQCKGPGFFQKYFQDKNVFAWKSVVKGGNGNLSAPFLSYSVDKLRIFYRSLDELFTAEHSALRFTN